MIADGPVDDGFSLGEPAMLDPGEAVQQWASTYDENPLTALDDIATRHLCPPVADATLLDVGCGPARGLPSRGPGSVRLAVGLDRSLAMLRSAVHNGRCFVVGRVEALPLTDAIFDIVWCRLTLGYVPALAAAYTELARVTRPGGRVLVTDFHSAALRAGHRRTFKDEQGNTRAIRSFVYQADQHTACAGSAGLTPVARLDLAVGPEVRRFYAAANRLEQYERDRDLPLLMGLCFTK